MDTKWIMLGLLIVLGGTFIPGATVVSDLTKPLFYLTLSNPSSNNPDVPSMLEPGDGGVLVWTAVADVSGIESVSVQVTGGSYDSGKQLCTLARLEEAAKVEWEIWEWQAPPLDLGIVYTFDWEAVEAQHGRISWGKTYGIFAEVDGYFKVNGQEITSTTQSLSLSSRALNMEFVATSDVEFITRVDVKVWNSDGLLIKSGQLTPDAEGHWIASPFYTFAKDGYFTVKGYIVSGSQSFLKMSLMHQVGDYPEEEDDEPGLLGGFLGQSWPYQAMGIIIVFYGLRKKKPVD